MPGGIGLLFEGRGSNGSEGAEVEGAEGGRGGRGWQKEQEEVVQGQGPQRSIPLHASVKNPKQVIS